MTKILLDENGKIMTNGKMIYTGSDGGDYYTKAEIDNLLANLGGSAKLYAHNITIKISDLLTFEICLYSSSSEKVTSMASFIKTFTHFFWHYDEGEYGGEYTMHVSTTNLNGSLEIYEKVQTGADSYNYDLIGLQQCVLQIYGNSVMPYYCPSNDPSCFDSAFNQLLGDITIYIGTYPRLDGGTGSSLHTIRYTDITLTNDYVKEV